jgi:hypothetical protein
MNSYFFKYEMNNIREQMSDMIVCIEPVRTRYLELNSVKTKKHGISS